MRLLTYLARRFVAGENAAAAIAVGARLNERGIRATFDLLGEEVRDAGAARRFADAIRELIRSIPAPIECNVSVKLSQLGLAISRDLCLELMDGLLRAAHERQGFVRIDMEGSNHTEDTLAVFRRLRMSHEQVGIVLQAALHRTRDDVAEAIRHKDRVRICKGAYHEPASIAWQKMSDIRERYCEYAAALLGGEARVAIATHDEKIIQRMLAVIGERQLAADRYEFQMLYGLRPKRWSALVAAGHAMRIYVPYGTHWLPYFMRRLREKKENVWFVLKGLIGG
ncbi:MAG: proline dehydrogenase family protein [Vicinamibacteria bacterium]|jgi:proline dehydrogenase|nr:proline dehydrogenase family protein [Vicinamibacteria bacterium]